MSEWWSEPQRVVQTNLRLTDATMDPRQVARDAKAFGATAIMFNVGGIWAWYPTALPLQAVNPYLKRDLVGEMLEACRAEGLHFIGRFDLSKGTQVAFDKHPDWFCVSRSGKPFEFAGTYQASITGGWYQEQGPALMTEVIRRYDLQACFFNMFGYQRMNYSHEDLGFSHDPSAVEAFAAFSGGQAIPDERDTSSAVYRQYLRFQDETSGALGRKIYDHVKALNPRIGVATLGGYKDWIRIESNRSVRRAQPEWQYQTGENTRFGQSVGRGKSPVSVAITHFFDFPWRYVAETEAFQSNRIAQALASGGDPHYYFMGPVSPQDDMKPVPAIKQVFAFHARHQDLYAGLTSASRIGLYQSKATDRFGHLVTPSDLHAQSAAPFRGAYRALLESGLAFDLVSDRLAGAADFPAILARYDVLVLPDVTCLGDAEAAALDAYVAAGGALVVTAETGFLDQHGQTRPANALRSMPFSRVEGTRRDMFASYVHIGDGELDALDAKVIMLDGVYVEVEPAPGAETLLRVQYPQAFGPPELSFPVEPLSTRPGVIIGAHGDGRVAYVPFAPDRLYYQYSLVEHRQLLAQLVGRFTRPIATLEHASRIELTVRRHETTGQTVVHLINYSGQSNNNFEPPVVQHGLQLLITGVAPGSAAALVSGTRVDVGPAGADGYSRVTLPPVGHWEALVFEPGERAAAPS